MANFHRRRNVPEPPKKMCKRHPGVPAAPRSDYCVNCTTYRARAKGELAKHRR